MIENIINIVVSSLSSFGILGGFLLILLESIIPALPLAVFIGLNNLAFGSVLGFIISYVGTLTGSILSFWLFRKVIRTKFNKYFKEDSKNKINKLITKFTRIKLSTLVIMIAIPFTPAFLINIAAGLSGIKFNKFLIALLIGKLSIIYFWGYIGTTLLESFKDPWIMIQILFLTLAAYIASKIITKLLKIE